MSAATPTGCGRARAARVAGLQASTGVRGVSQGSRLAALGRGVHDEGLVGERVDLDRLFEESSEEEAPELGATSVEPERKLVEVRLEVVPLYSSLVGTQQPSFHEACDAVYSRQDHMRRDAGAGDGEGPVTVVVVDGEWVRHEAHR